MNQQKLIDIRHSRLARRHLLSAALIGVAAHAGIAPAWADIDDEDYQAQARVMPPSPAFPRNIDAYASYEPQTTCSATNKPGPLDLRNIVFNTYGQRPWSIARSCAGSSVSEHKEGRALDISFNALNSTQRKLANDFLYWLLKPDPHGNRHAFARRFGIMYIIWNHKIWRAYRPNEGWQPYTGSNPHTDHIHISFGWRGALRRTSWWTRQVFS
jgi:hypothetical protein